MAESHVPHVSENESQIMSLDLNYCSWLWTKEVKDYCLDADNGRNNGDPDGTYAVCQLQPRSSRVTTVKR